MACGILSIPITIVALESSFSIGGHILHMYRNCLVPKTVQALIFTRNWLHDFKEIRSLVKIAYSLNFFFFCFLLTTYKISIFVL